MYFINEIKIGFSFIFGGRQIMIYGYARCSTAEKENKQSVDRQILELKNMGVLEKNIHFEYESRYERK